LPTETGAAMRVVNQSLEASVRRMPEQYLWTYQLHRYRHDQTPPTEPAA
jgi:lauroyl/myristoyl acyltransferase